MVLIFSPSYKTDRFVIFLKNLPILYFPNLFLDPFNAYEKALNFRLKYIKVKRLRDFLAAQLFKST